MPADAGAPLLLSSLVASKQKADHCCSADATPSSERAKSAFPRRDPKTASRRSSLTSYAPRLRPTATGGSGVITLF